MSDNAPLLERVFDMDVEEGSYTVERVEGRVPDFVRGRYYLNGPARFQRGDFRYRHWLDGDGMVCSLRFEPGRVAFANRFVRSHKYVTEEAAGAPVYRTFGTSFEGDQMLRGVALASPANVSVYTFAGKLLAFGEQGLPYELDPDSLETVGEHTFGGRLNAVTPFSAHPKFDSDTGEMLNFGISFSATRPMLNVFHFGAEGGLTHRRRLELPFPCSVHDFSISDQFVVFFLSPYLLDMGTLMGGTRSLIQALNWEAERGSRLLIMSRETGELVNTVPVGDGYCLHLANSFEEDGRLVVDLIELTQPIYDQYQVVPDLFTDVRRAAPVRLEIDLEEGKLKSRRALDYGMMCDFPAIDPRRAQQRCEDTWVLGISQTERPGRKFLDQLVHLDWRNDGTAKIYQAPEGHYLGGEPVFVPDPDDEMGGAVICQVFDPERRSSSFCVFDAFGVERGPVATLQLESPVHLGFHTCFEPEVS